MMRTIRGFIFDFDGLILDTEMPSLHAWQTVYRNHGSELPFEKYILTVGTDDKSFNPARYLQILVGKPGIEIAAAQEHKAVLHELLKNAQMMPGIDEYLTYAQSREIKTAIASSSSDAWVRGHLARLDSLKYFDAIVTAGSVHPAKPDPQVYTLALRELSLLPSEAIAFEDSKNGIRAAHLAGIFCVAVPNSVTVSMDFQESDLQIPSLMTINPSELIQLVESIS